MGLAEGGLVRWDPVPRVSNTLVVACGALAREISMLRRVNGWRHLTVQCLPADFHNHPDRIADAVDRKLTAGRGVFESMFVAYAECGTRGRLDAVLDKHGVERLPGDHCYGFFAGRELFAALADEEPGTFYLTDFLVRHFDRLVIRGLGIDRHPELEEAYFGNYRRLVYLAQVEDDRLLNRAKAAARRLHLTFTLRVTGFGELEKGLAAIAPVSTGASSGRTPGA